MQGPGCRLSLWICWASRLIGFQRLCGAGCGGLALLWLQFFQVCCQRALWSRHCLFWSLQNILRCNLCLVHYQKCLCIRKNLVPVGIWRMLRDRKEFQNWFKSFLFDLDFWDLVWELFFSFSFLVLEIEFRAFTLNEIPSLYSLFIVWVKVSLSWPDTIWPWNPPASASQTWDYKFTASCARLATIFFNAIFSALINFIFSVSY